MTDFQTHYQHARDAWNLVSWLIYPENEQAPANPDKLEKLADKLDKWGATHAAAPWPDALRFTARSWRASEGKKRDQLHRCPECLGRNLHISAEVICRLEEITNADCVFDVAAIIDNSDPYWDDDSTAICQECDYIGRIRDFKPMFNKGVVRPMEAFHG